jgi:hypothetical protein
VSIDPNTFYFRSCRAMRILAVDLGRMLGVSRRTAQRWSGTTIPSSAFPKLASLVHPHDRSLAAEIASAAGTTLIGLGLEQPPPPPPAESPPASPAREPIPVHPGIVDAVVCSAADAMNLMPRDVRPGLHAAVVRARELGLTLEAIEKALASALRAKPSKGREAPPPTTTTR